MIYSTGQETSEGKSLGRKKKQEEERKRKVDKQGQCKDPLCVGAFPVFCLLSKLAKAESKLLKMYAKRHKTTTKTLYLDRVSQKNKHELKK